MIDANIGATICVNNNTTVVKSAPRLFQTTACKIIVRGPVSKIILIAARSDITLANHCLYWDRL